ncbi:Violaxanthin de-epoxidase [Picochlorum sp. SENEW3]|nr:Violaxanthin de-epoxidase [Picochlorum sp. SENEW3]
MYRLQWGTLGIENHSSRQLFVRKQKNNKIRGIAASMNTPRIVAMARPETSHTASPSKTAKYGAASIAASALLMLTPPTIGGYPDTQAAYAASSSGSDVGVCVLKKCQKALAGCLADPQCLENLVCLQQCNGKDDETPCQIKCGDKYQDAAIDTFNKCAVSEKKCVPQRVDEGVYPIPPDCALDSAFDLSMFQGRWYITAGLNPLFDTFPCQEHYFASPKDSSDVVFAEINWRIPASDGKDFIQRSTMQRFVQTPDNPAILLNHDNEFLHYEDDWYIVASKPDAYVFIYYRGQNDAWKGYGGATVYTRDAHLPEEYIPELRQAAENAGLSWDDFTITDNACPPKPVSKGPFEELKEDFSLAEDFASKEMTTLIEPELKSFGKGFTILEKEVESVTREITREVQEEEKIIEKQAQEAARRIRRFQMEASMGRWVQSIPLPIREIIMPVR